MLRAQRSNLHLLGFVIAWGIVASDSFFDGHDITSYFLLLTPYFLLLTSERVEPHKYDNYLTGHDITNDFGNVTRILLIIDYF